MQREEKWWKRESLDSSSLTGCSRFYLLLYLDFRLRDPEIIVANEGDEALTNNVPNVGGVGDVVGTGDDNDSTVKLYRWKMMQRLRM